MSRKRKQRPPEDRAAMFAVERLERWDGGPEKAWDLLRIQRVAEFYPAGHKVDMGVLLRLRSAGLLKHPRIRGVLSTQLFCLTERGRVWMSGR